MIELCELVNLEVFLDIFGHFAQEKVHKNFVTSQGVDCRTNEIENMYGSNSLFWGNQKMVTN